MVPATESIALARSRGVATIIDAAAQDLRLAEVIATGADLVLTSAQKYLCGPTAGLVLGRRELVDALRAQEKGIGRGMKAGKEAVAGALAALDYRYGMDMAAWAREQDDNAAALAGDLNATTPLRAELVPDPTDMPFSRVRAWVDRDACGKTAKQLAAALAAGDPLISVQDHADEDRALMFETVGMNVDEIEIICGRIAALIS